MTTYSTKRGGRGKEDCGWGLVNKYRGSEDPCDSMFYHQYCTIMYKKNFSKIAQEEDENGCDSCNRAQSLWKS